jgi:S1-C subfamily serine protease
MVGRRCIDSVDDGKPAAIAGLVAGDIILEINGINVEMVDSNKSILSEMNKPALVLSMIILRAPDVSFSYVTSLHATSRHVT